MMLASSLPDKSILSFNCMDCGAENDFERKGISNGFSYLEIPYKEKYVCKVCNKEQEISSLFMYGFVRN